MNENGKYTLVASRGCGSAIVEAALVLSGLPYAIDEVDYEKPGPGRDRLRALNPLGQVPTLLLPDGAVMTESAAMVLHLAETVPGAALAPPPGDAARAHFLRWLTFLVASIYPTFTYGDDPSRWVSSDAAQKELRDATDTHRQEMWRSVEAAASAGPWFIGDRFSALDLYLSVMTHWRPRRAWFATHCPRLDAIARSADDLPALAETWARNFA